MTERSREGTVPPGRPVDDRIGYLDRTAASDAGRDYKRRLLDALDVRPGQAVLDVGCGPGTDLPALAAAVGPDGTVTGVDRDLAMLAQARERTAALRTVGLPAGDAHALPVASGSVHRARADRVYQHLAEPARALAELHRVLRPGGLVALADPDWDTLAIDDPDLDTSRAYTRYVTGHVVRNPAFGRQAARLLAEAGFAVESVLAVPVMYRDHAAAAAILRMPAVAERAWRAGELPEPAARAWLERLRTGAFLAGLTLYLVTARRPAR
jgi:ubiquinone/menaquinone biosynthesis C-methylase UbiE